MSIQCPRCGNNVAILQPLDPALYAQLTAAGQTGIPPEVCTACYGQLAASVSKGSVLVAQEKAREQRKLMIWKTRVGFVKKGRQLMGQKSYSEAAVAYEKYLRALEIVLDAKPGGLTPEQFKESARTKELTVVSSVYWDLMRIYDTSNRYGDRMIAASNKLSQFLRLTPIYPDIIKKAQIFARTSKHPAVVKAFLKASAQNKNGCFIASAAFESPFSPEVQTLRRFRDEHLLPSPLGRVSVRIYYRLSPSVALFLERWPALKKYVRWILRRFIRFSDRCGLTSGNRT